MLALSLDNESLDLSHIFSYYTVECVRVKVAKISKVFELMELFSRHIPVYDMFHN